jgi:hypothetical protein
VGQITDHVIAYRDGNITFEDLATFVADFTYKPCPPLGIWQMWGGGHALDDTVQEMLGTAETLLSDDEYLALMKAIKSRWAAASKLRDLGGRGKGNGGQPAAE